jgi:hypothetical protein
MYPGADPGRTWSEGKCENVPVSPDFTAHVLFIISKDSEFRSAKYTRARAAAARARPVLTFESHVFESHASVWRQRRARPGCEQISAGDPEAILFGGARVMHGHVCGFWILEPFFRRRSKSLFF